MRYFPIFMDMQDQEIILIGGGEAAIAKLRLFLKTPAKIRLYADDILAGFDREFGELLKQGQIMISPLNDVNHHSFTRAQLCYIALETSQQAAIYAKLARENGAIVNIVDDQFGSDFLTPAMLDRDPVVIAIGTEGAAPVLARMIKQDLEERFSANLGSIAKLASNFRNKASLLPKGKIRRDFWQSFFLHFGLHRNENSANPVVEAEVWLNHHLDQALARQDTSQIIQLDQGSLKTISLYSADAEDLSLRNRKLIDQADVLICHPDIPAPILELARREAIIIYQSHEQNEDKGLIAKHLAHNQRIVHILPIQENNKNSDIGNYQIPPNAYYSKEVLHV